MRALALAFLIGVCIAAPIALLVGYKIWHVDPTALSEPPAPGYVQDDAAHSRVLPRTPVTALPPAPHKIPAGSVEVRRAHVTVQPHATSTDACAAACDPLDLDLSLVRDADGHRMVASSPNGAVTGGDDLVLADFGVRAKRMVAVATYAGRDSWSGLLLRKYELLGFPVLAGGGLIKVPDEQIIPSVALGFEF